MWGTVAYLGTSALKLLGGMSGAQSQAKAAEKLRKAQNVAIMKSTYRAIGSINENKIQAIQQSRGLSEAIQRDEISDMGSAEVSAAAAGVQGKSVDLTFGSINREAARREVQRQETLKSQLAAYDQQMKSTWDTGFNNLDNTPTQDQSGGKLLGGILDMAAGYQKGSAAFDQITGTVGKWLGFGKGTAGGSTVGGTAGSAGGGLGSIFSSVGSLLNF